MDTKSRMILVSNTGVLVVHNNVRILLDGLYKDLGGNFSQLPPYVWKMMQAGRGELANVDYLLFSHSHYDHYYEPYFRAYMKSNKVRGICFPPIDHTEGLRESAQQYQEQTIQFTKEKEAWLEGNILLKKFMTRHIDQRFYHIKNQSFSLTLNERVVAFLADADNLEDFSGFQADIAFVTPIFYNHPTGRAALIEDMGVKEIIIYHLPTMEEDKHGYYKMAERDMKKYEAAGVTVRIWNRTGQEISF